MAKSPPTSSRLHALLKRMTVSLGEKEAVWITNREGRPLATDVMDPVPDIISNRSRLLPGPVDARCRHLCRCRDDAEAARDADRSSPLSRPPPRRKPSSTA